MGSRIVMEIQAAPNQVEALDLDEYISVVSSLSPLPSLPSTGGSNENITRIHRDLYSAAVKVNYLEFINIQNLESLRTPNKNTVLHIHLTSTTSETTQTRETKPVSEEFVTRILETCEGLVLVPNAKGETLLHIAARYGHSNIAKLLVERVKAFPRDIESGIGAEKKFIRATNNEKDTALHEAVRYHHIEVVKTLLEMDPDYSYCANTANETPLYLASERRYQQVVAEILNKVKSPAYDGPNNRTALHAAVINKDIEIARYLLQNEHVKVAVRQADKKGCIPLHYAVKIGNKNMTKLLLESDETNSTAYMQDNEGRTALHIAAYADHCSILEMIIKIFPDCSELVDNKGRNALHYAVDGGRWFAVNKIMRNPSLSNLYNEKDVEGNTPLHLCTNNPILASRLVNHRRVDKQAVNKKDQTALDVAYDNIEGSTVSKLNLITVLEGAGAKRSQRLVDESKNGQEKGDGLVFTKEAKESHLIVATLIATARMPYWDLPRLALQLSLLDCPSSMSSEKL
ncbi:Ankyrin repeat-containing protein [Spatholobus suberectus]|nr:Ankyrin repeat-containing protein [Spatholobus suberectus]